MSKYQIVDIDVVDVKDPDADDDYDSKYSTDSDMCEVRLFCASETGESALLRVHGFRPYFYSHIPAGVASRPQLTKLFTHADSTFELCWKKLFYGWQPDPDDACKTKQHLFAKRTFKSCRMFGFACRKDVYELDRSRSIRIPNMETNVQPLLQFLDTTKLKASGWFQIPAGLPRLSQFKKISTCSHEYILTMKDLTPLPDETAIAPMLIASFDIECMSNSGGFPQASLNDPVIQIGVSWKRYMEPDSAMNRLVFCLHETDPVPGVQIRWFDNELDMLIAFRDFIVDELDPDIITGYNIDGFDWKYMCDRANNTHRFCSFSRIKHAKTPLKPHNFTSAAYGETTSYRMTLTGRLVVDMFTYEVRNEYPKLRSYSLKAVSEKFLGDKKVDLPYDELFRLFPQGPSARARIAEYCAKDCDLPLRLLENRVVIPNMVEMSRVTHVPTQYLLTRGQQIKVFSLIVLVAHEMGHVVNKLELAIDAEKYQGATVVDPFPGFYKEPITTLDFASLYPSIICGHNLCYSTYVPSPEQLIAVPEEPVKTRGESPGDFERRVRAYKKAHARVQAELADARAEFERVLALPGVQYQTFQGADTYTFVQHVPGVLPEILIRLLRARAETRALIKKTDDPVKKQILNGRQLAFKVSANSVYGFTGVKPGKGILPCLPIADAVTATGRNMIEVTKRAVTEKYPGSRIIYGDTDSVMIQFDVSHLPTKKEKILECFRLGNEAADYVTSLFPDSVVLEMEKVYAPYLLFKKKRYAANMFMSPDGAPVKDTKGIEPARRDYCLYTCNTYNSILDALFDTEDVNAAVDTLKRAMQRLADDDTDINDFVMTKELKQTYKKPETQPHVAVVERMRERAPGSEPKAGSRVPFVVVQHPDPKAKLVEKVDDPAYVSKHGIALDYLHYFESNMEKPLWKLMRLMVKDPNVLFNPVRSVLSKAQKRQSTLRVGDDARAPKRQRTIEWRAHQVRIATTDDLMEKKKFRQTSLYEQIVVPESRVEALSKPAPKRAAKPKATARKSQSLAMLMQCATKRA